MGEEPLDDVRRMIGPSLVEILGDEHFRRLLDPVRSVEPEHVRDELAEFEPVASELLRRDPVRRLRVGLRATTAPGSARGKRRRLAWWAESIFRAGVATESGGREGMLAALCILVHVVAEREDLQPLEEIVDAMIAALRGLEEGDQHPALMKAKMPAGRRPSAIAAEFKARCVLAVEACELAGRPKPVTLVAQSGGAAGRVLYRGSRYLFGPGMLRGWVKERREIISNVPSGRLQSLGWLPHGAPEGSERETFARDWAADMLLASVELRHFRRPLVAVFRERSRNFTKRRILELKSRG